MLDDAITLAVKSIVRRQAETGIDIVSDGEQSKTGFYSYVRERLGGFESRPNMAVVARARREREAFPEYYERYFKRDTTNVGDRSALVCTGPITYTGQAAIQRDIANLKAALEGLDVTEVFMPSAGPRSMGLNNEYYKTREEYLAAIAEAMREEYKAIIDAGFILQLDDPSITDIFSEADVATREERRKGVAQSVEIINHSLRGLPEDRIRFHTCYGINEGPRITDAPMEDILDLVLQITAGAYSFEAGNPRHDHDFHAFEKFKLPEGKIVIPGVISHTTNMVEHPEVIARRLTDYAGVVGRENVIAGRRLRLLVPGQLRAGRGRPRHVAQVRGDGRGRASGLAASVEPLARGILREWFPRGRAANLTALQPSRLTGTQLAVEPGRGVC